VGDPFTATIRVDGTRPVDVALTAGALPAGLTIVTTAGGVTISGTPLSAGPADFVLTATNAAGDVTRTYRLVVEPLPVRTGPGGVGGTTPGSGAVGSAGVEADGGLQADRPAGLARTGAGDWEHGGAGLLATVVIALGTLLVVARARRQDTRR
jgi:large repetitive protein